MSIMSQLKGKGNAEGRSDWTRDDMKLAVGLKLGGAKRSDIEKATGHPANSVTYLFNRKLTAPVVDENGKPVKEVYIDKKGKTKERTARRPFDDQELLDCLGVETIEEVIEFTEQKLTDLAG